MKWNKRVMTKEKKSKVLRLSIIIIAFLLFRFLILFSDIKQTDMYEERPMGALAYNMIHKGITLPFFGYQYTENHGGHLISAILTIPFFYLFGTSLISLKLIPLCFFSLGTLILWFIFLDKYFNRRSALLFSVLYILSPPYFSMNNMISWALHIEVNLFTIAAILIFYKLLDRNDFSAKENKISILTTIAALGILSGISIFVAYTFIITIISCFIIWLVADKNGFPKSCYLVFLAGLLIGFSPMIFYLLSEATYNFYIQKKPYIPDYPLSYLLRKFIRLLALGIPESFYFSGKNIFKKINATSLIYHLVFVLSYAAMILKNRDFIKKLLPSFLPIKNFKIKPYSIPKEAILLIFPFIFSFVFTISQFEAPDFVPGTNQGYNYLNFYRYLLPLFPFIFAIISVAGESLFSKPRWSIQVILGTVIFAYLFLVGISGNLALVSLNKYFSSGLIHKGYWMEPYMRKFIYINKNFNKITAAINKIEEEDKPLTTELFGEKVASKLGEKTALIIKEGDKVDKNYQKYFYYGAFSYLANNKITPLSPYAPDKSKLAVKVNDNPEEIIGLIEQIPSEFKPSCYEVLGYIVSLKFKAGNTTILKNFIDRISEKFKPYFYIGLGRSLVNLSIFYYQIDSIDVESINFIEPAYKEYCYEGIGKEIGNSLNEVRLNLFQLKDIDPNLRKFYFEELDSYMDKSFYWITGLDKEFRNYVYKGIGEAAGEIFKNKTIADYIGKRIPGEYEDFYIQGLKKEGIHLKSGKKRVLLIAPHPDDEALGCAKVISDSVDKGYPVKLLVMTNGDRLFFINKKIMYDFDHNGYIDYLDYGYIRQQETIKAMGKLGLDPKNIIFLGYPDGYLWKLYNYEYNGIYFNIRNPLKLTPAINTGETSVSPYRNSYHSLVHPDEPTVHSRGYVVTDLEEIFRNFKPTDVYMTFEFDNHPDHQIIPFFVKKVLQDLKNSNEEFAFQIKTHRYLIHLTSKNNYPDPDNSRLGVRDEKNCNRIKWEDTRTKCPPNGSILLSSEFKKIKYEIINCYSTQYPKDVSKSQPPCTKAPEHSWMQLFVKDREEWWDLPTNFNVPFFSFDQLGTRDKILYLTKNFLTALNLEWKRFLSKKTSNSKTETP